MEHSQQDIRQRPSTAFDSRPARWIEWGLWSVTTISTMAICSIVVLLVYFCVPLFTSGTIAEVLSRIWQPFGCRFGFLPMCAGSLYLSTPALILAFPAAVGICCLVHVLALRRVARFFLFLIHFMTGIPTVICGFVSVFLLVPWMRDWLSAGTGFSLMTATLTPGLLILPTIVLVLHVHMQQIDPSIRLVSAALGLTPPQQVVHVLLPMASRARPTGCSSSGTGRSFSRWTLATCRIATCSKCLSKTSFDSV